eukprot:2163704-Rhodomonas_salina.3
MRAWAVAVLFILSTSSPAVECWSEAEGVRPDAPRGLRCATCGSDTVSSSGESRYLTTRVMRDARS